MLRVVYSNKCGRTSFLPLIPGLLRDKKEMLKKHPYLTVFSILWIPFLYLSHVVDLISYSLTRFYVSCFVFKLLSLTFPFCSVFGSVRCFNIWLHISYLISFWHQNISEVKSSETCSYLPSGRESFIAIWTCWRAFSSRTHTKLAAFFCRGVTHSEGECTVSRIQIGPQNKLCLFLGGRSVQVQ